MLELEKDIDLFEDKFNESVLKNVDIEHYRVIDKFIKSMLEIYVFALSDVSEKRDSNVSDKLIAENNRYKNIFLRLVEQQDIGQAVDVLLLKNASKKLDDNFTAVLEAFASKSFSKHNLSIAIKEDIINSKIAKYLLNEKNINGLVRYLQNEILQRIKEDKEKRKIGRVDYELMDIKDEVLNIQKNILKPKLIKILESCESAEEFWEKF